MAEYVSIIYKFYAEMSTSWLINKNTIQYDKQA